MDTIGGVFNPNNKKKSNIEGAINKQIAQELGAKPALKKPDQPSNLQQVNATQPKKDPELIRLEKLHAEIEKKNDADIKKGLTVQIEPKKNSTFLTFMKSVVAKHKKLDEKKLPLVL